MLRIFFLLIFASLLSSTGAQDYKKLALDEFINEHYQNAAELMQKAKMNSPMDPEIYYYLGVITHYLCYDSTPLTNSTDSSISDSVLTLLKKATQLKPDYGDAYYFIGAEYGARAVKQMRERNVDGIKGEYILSLQSGGMPDWLLEYGRNLLRSCESNAILFTGGDSEFNPITYLQVVENYRTDVTVIPVGFLDRPWFISYLKNGLRGVLNPVRISLSDDQISDMHPYKWKTTSIEVIIPNELISIYKLQDTLWKWELRPDLKRDKRELLSTHGAVLMNIIQANKWERAICFTPGCQQWMYFGLDRYFQLSGLVNKILPFETGNSESIINADFTYNLLSKNDYFSDLKTLRNTDMPRISSCIMNYFVVHLRLAGYYAVQKQTKLAEGILKTLDNNIPLEIYPRNKMIEKEIERIIILIKDTNG